MNYEKQPLEAFYKKSCPYSQESACVVVSGLQLDLKETQTKAFFPVNIAKFLRTNEEDRQTIVSDFPLKTLLNVYWRIILSKFLSTPFVLGWLSFLTPDPEPSYSALRPQPPVFSPHKSFSQLSLLLIKVQWRWLCATFNGFSLI